MISKSVNSPNVWIFLNSLHGVEVKYQFKEYSGTYNIASEYTAVSKVSEIADGGYWQLQMISRIFSLPENAYWDMYKVPLELNVIDCNPSHPAKAEFWIDVTELGIITLSRLLQ